MKGMTLTDEVIQDLSYTITEVMKKYDFYIISKKDNNPLSLLFSDMSEKFQFKIKIEVLYEKVER